MTWSIFLQFSFLDAAHCTALFQIQASTGFGFTALFCEALSTTVRLIEVLRTYVSKEKLKQ